MRSTTSRFLRGAPLLLLAFAAACGSRPVPLPPAVPLRSATLAQLVSSFNRNASAIQTMSLKLNLSARAGKNKVPKMAAFLLIRKPGEIRLWATMTLVGKLFDMASNGQRFELLLPTRNQFFVGRNNVIPAKVSNPLEKIRPQVILKALLINPILPSTTVALDPGAPAGTYRVLVLAPDGDGEQRVVRRITFSRYDLLPHRQEIYDGDGIHLTQATYSEFATRNNLPIPTDITIERPVEGYSLHLQLLATGIVLNQPFNAPDIFQLTPPKGAAVITLGDPPK